MALETELKLRITPEHLARLKRHVLFKKHQITAPKTLRLYNVYYDTPELELHKRKMALRLRRVGGKWIQTLKGGGQMMAGLHQRFEWEVPVPSARLDFSGLDELVWDEHLPRALRAGLQPVFITDFYRSSRMLAWQGAVIEVCMDKGAVKTADHSTPICELELELKSGEPAQLFELALAIIDIVPFELETVSKAEQGFRLMSDYTAHPVKSTVPDIAKAHSLTEGLQMLIWSCLQHLQANLRGVMCDAENHDNEYLHQLRVSLRRLRVVLSMAGKLHVDDELISLRQSLATLGVTLGRIREWDVFIAGMSVMLPEHAGLEGLLKECRIQRSGLYVALRSHAPELQRLLLRLSIWMNGSYWQAAAQHAPEMREFSTSHLHRLARRQARAEQDLHALDMQRLHALRIQTKKLRYSAEFFSSLYDAKKVKSYLDTLGRIQDLLGEINDISVARLLFEDLVQKFPECGEASLFARGVMDANSINLFKELHNNIKLFYRQRIFWK